VRLPLNMLAMIVTGALAEACLLVADAEDPRPRRAPCDVVRARSGASRFLPRQVSRRFWTFYFLAANREATAFA
jgi:hypothetical protein